MIIVLDLDDTLFEELSFVRSGFRAVSQFLYEGYRIPITDSYEFMLEYLQNGRGTIFNETLNYYGICSKKLVKSCISTYRFHIPQIFLYEDANWFLNEFNNYSIYIVTDGHKYVQTNKIHALGIDKRVKRTFITHRFGIRNAKPSPYCFQKICELEKVEPSNIIYIGDNPNKDFVGIKPYGFKTIRIMRGNYSNIRLGIDYEADHEINNLKDLDHQFLKKILINSK